MKKIILIIVTLFFFSCDEIVNYNFFLENNCNELINITIVDYKNKEISIDIVNMDSVLVYTSKGVNFLTDKTIESVFNSIVIRKGNKISSKNYVDRNLWDFRVVSDTQANCILTIDSTHFE